MKEMVERKEEIKAMHAKVAYSIDEFCALAGIGRTLAYAEIKEGRLRTRKAGRRTIILPADVDTWLSELPAGGSKDAA